MDRLFGTQCSTERNTVPSTLYQLLRHRRCWRCTKRAAATSRRDHITQLHVDTIIPFQHCIAFVVLHRVAQEIINVIHSQLDRFISLRNIDKLCKRTVMYLVKVLKSRRLVVHYNTPWATKKCHLIFHCNSRISGWILGYTFSTNGNGKEYTTVSLFNGLMTAQLCDTAMFNSMKCSMKWNMGICWVLKTKFDQSQWKSKRLSAQRLIEECPNKNRKDKHWMTVYERWAWSVRSNALQEAVGHDHTELQITLPQLKTQLRWSCKFYNCSVDHSFLFSLVHNL